MAVCNYSMTIRRKDYTDDARRLAEKMGVPYYATYQVPCGKCDNCLTAKAKDWMVRLHYQNKDAESAHFVTLTYGYPVRSYNGLFTLHKPDLQNYFKRLRKREKGNDSIKYYAVGEYGEQYQRPHYHAIVFNVRDERNIFKAWTIDDKAIGHVHVGAVEAASIMYVSGYIGKKIGIPQYDYDDRVAEFSIMSKGLGMNYLDYSGHWNKKNEETHTVIDQKTYRLPRYIKEKIFDKQTLEKIKVKNYERFKEKQRRIEDLSMSLGYDKYDLALHLADAHASNKQSSSIVIPDI